MWALIEERSPIVVAAFNLASDVGIDGKPGIRQWFMTAYCRPYYRVYDLLGSQTKVVFWMDDMQAIALEGFALVNSIDSNGRVNFAGSSALTWVQREYPLETFAGLNPRMSVPRSDVE